MVSDLTLCIVIFLIPAQTTLKILTIPQTFYAFSCAHFKAKHNIVFQDELVCVENTDKELSQFLILDLLA